MNHPSCDASHDHFPPFPHSGRQVPGPLKAEQPEAAVAWYQRGRGGCYPHQWAPNHAALWWPCWQGYLFCLGEQQVS